MAALVPALLSAIADPNASTRSCLDTLLATTFVNTIDAPSLALVVPVVHRGLRDRSGDTKKRAARIVGNMCSLTNDPKVGSAGGTGQAGGGMGAGRFLQSLPAVWYAVSLHGGISVYLCALKLLGLWCCLLCGGGAVLPWRVDEQRFPYLCLCGHADTTNSL
jgi:hypothetical protein